MIEVHGWGSTSVIETRDPSPILLATDHIVSVSYDWRSGKVTVICVSSVQFFLAEDYATVRAMLDSPRMNSGRVWTAQRLLNERHS